MSARSTNAFLASAVLHALMLGVVVLLAFLTNRQVQEATPIFELVAGEGDNYAATEAPALGVPGGSKVELPEIPSPAPSPIEAAAPEPEPPSPVEAAPAPPEPKPATAKPEPKEFKPVNMAKMVDRIADKRAANVERRIRAEQAAAEARAAKEAAAKPRMTKAEFDRLNKGKTSAATTARATGGTGGVKRIDAEGIAGGVRGGSTANKTGGAGGKALTREEIELSDAYIALLVRQLRDAHQKPEGLSDLLNALVKFRLTSSGTVVNVMIARSSGNAEFDQSVLAAFRRISLPPPPPGFKTSDYTIPFRMREE